MLVSTVMARTRGAAIPSRAASSLLACDGRLHHLLAAQSVDVEEVDPEPGRRLRRLGDGVRDVVELEVEEDAVAGALEFPDEVRTLGREQPALRP